MTMRSHFGVVRSALAPALVALLAGCASVMDFESGTEPVHTVRLESKLQPGVSTTSDVLRELGEPYGKGAGFMPFHEAPRVVWTYFRDEGSVDLGKGDMKSVRTYLFVFLAGDVFDSYMWFTSKLTSAQK
jgi:hypothetical protein